MLRVRHYIAVMTSDLFNLPADLRTRVQAELQPGERILYAGMPDWRAEWGNLLAIFLFGVGWGGISFTFLFMMAGAALGIIPFKFEGEPGSRWMAALFCLFLIPFAAIGVTCLAAPFLGIAKSRRTAHVVTDTRLFTVRGGWSAGAESTALCKVNFVRRKDRKGGTGCLDIGYGIAHDADGDPRPLITNWTGIPDVKRAERAIAGRG